MEKFGILGYLVLSIMMLFIVDIDGCWSPKVLYDKGLNWFGSIFIFILFMIVNPFGLVIRIFYWIFRFFKWLFTVGR